MVIAPRVPPRFQDRNETGTACSHRPESSTLKGISRRWETLIPEHLVHVGGFLDEIEGYVFQEAVVVIRDLQQGLQQSGFGYAAMEKAVVRFKVVLAM